MNSKELKENCEEQKGLLKKKFSTITDNDSIYLEGKKEEMLGKLQIKLGKSKEELQKVLKSI